MTIDKAKDFFERGILSRKNLVEVVLNNIALLGCATGAYITVDRKKAAEDAENFDREANGGILCGIPIAVKDNICTKDMLTTAGSRMLGKYVPDYDATAVKRLREEGAIIIGKTNMDEFGMGSGCENSAYKLTANPLNYAYVPGGSSGGSACAVKSGQAVAALGSDTGGSVRLPAAFCGLYGLKPTYSLVSRFGLIEYATSLDTIGTITSSVCDGATILNIIAGCDERDMTGAKRDKINYTKCLGKGVKGMKIGVPWEFFENCDEDVKAVVLQAAEKYKELGAVVERCNFPPLKYAEASYYIIASCEAFSNMARYDGIRFSKRAANCGTVEELYTKSRSEGFGSEVKKRIMFGAFALKGDNYDNYYKKAVSARMMIKKEFEKLFEKFDVLITPVCQRRVWQRGEEASFTEEMKINKCTAAVSLGGNPAMSVPCGTDKNNMPVGFQIVGRHFGEEDVLNVAYTYEKEVGFCHGV